MRLKTISHLSLVALAFSATSLVYAQTPQERAAKIKEWRTNCGDPDPDLRLAYIEGAIESGDQTIIRTCIKQTLKSDNPDTRNMALRAALAASERLTMTIDMPKAYYALIEKANGDSQQIDMINSRNRGAVGIVKTTNGQLGLLPKDVAFDSQTSKWDTLWENTKPKDRAIAEFAIIGDAMNGSGLVNYSGTNFDEFNVSMTLMDDGHLSGTAQVGRYSDFQVSIKLF